MQTLKHLIKSSSGLLIFSMLLSFIVTALIETFFLGRFVLMDLTNSQNYAYIIAALFALLFEIGRFALGISSANEFFSGQVFKGIFGMVISLALTGFLSHALGHMMDLIDSEAAKTLVFYAYGTLWLGFVLEIRLGINLANSQNKTTNSNKGTNSVPIILQATKPKPKPTHQNGNGNGVKRNIQNSAFGGALDSIKNNTTKNVDRNGQSAPTKTCNHCGKDITHKKHWNAQYCNDECRVAAWKKRTGKKLTVK